jgi:hypothetical protein
MRVVVVEATGNNPNRNVVPVHGTQSHYANSCLQRQEVQVVMTPAFRENTDAFIVIERFPDLLIELCEI